MQISYGSKSDSGRVRPSNEDSYGAHIKIPLFLVADGMGGHAAGEIASQIAAATVEEVMLRQDDNIERPEDVLRRAAEEANKRVFETQRQRPEYAGMGSTLTALSIKNNHYYIAHVGDSRAYLLRSGALDQLTRDHSLVCQLYESGVLERDQLSSHPQKHVITRSIGSTSSVEVDIKQGDALMGDVYLLCSDGLTDVLTHEGIRQILSAGDKTPQQLCEDLVDAANSGGGPDNVTVVVIRLEK